MKIVILDGYTENPGDLSWDEFRQHGELEVYDRTPADLIIERIGDAEIVITNKTKISKETILSCKNIQYIGILATGYDVIDIEATREAGIVVSNIPTYGTAAVSQYAIAMLLEVCHHIGAHSGAVKRGDWSSSEDWTFWNYPLIELAGKTMGVIGFGRIGQATAKIAQALGMNIIAYDSYKIPELISESCRYEELDVLLAESDVITLHCPLTKSTMNMINHENINKMKDGVILINTSRGQLVNEEDLKSALNSGKVSAAAVDVVSIEPIEVNNPLLSAKNIIITPHIAWATKESRTRLMGIALENLVSFKKGNPINVVNN